MNKWINCLLIVLFALVIAAWPGAVFGSDNSISIAGEKAGLDAKQVQALKSPGIEILVPSYIPDGFKVSAARVQWRDEKKKLGPSYMIAYKGPGKKAFVVESGSGKDIRSPDLKKFKQADKALVSISGSEVPIFMKLSGKTGFFVSDWIRANNHYYRLTGAGSIPETRDSISVGVKEAKKILESLRYLK